MIQGKKKNLSRLLVGHRLGSSLDAIHSFELKNEEIDGACQKSHYIHVGHPRERGQSGVVGEFNDDHYQ